MDAATMNAEADNLWYRPDSEIAFIRELRDQLSAVHDELERLHGATELSRHLKSMDARVRGMETRLDLLMADSRRLIRLGIAMESIKARIAALEETTGNRVQQEGGAMR